MGSRMSSPRRPKWGPHTHPAHELLWVRHGTLTSRVGDQLVPISVGFDLWIPAGVLHSDRLTAHVDLIDAFFAPGRTPPGLDSPTVVSIPALREALLEHLAREDLNAGERARAEVVVVDTLAPSQHRLELLLPKDPRLGVIAEAVLEDAADGRSLEAGVRELGVSPLAITRTVRATTGFSFARWRQALRVHRALALLSDGTAVQDVFAQLGYLHPSTSTDAFRRVMGSIPGALSPVIALCSRHGGFLPDRCVLLAIGIGSCAAALATARLLQAAPRRAGGATIRLGALDYGCRSTA